tara:strand:+ start:61 stop:1350 length:1290 start_codon:yes stop_codon:yes gene_type:complete
MKVTRRQLRNTIQEVVMHEWIADQSTPIPSQRGVTNDTTSVSGAIDSGNELEARLIEEMRAKAIQDFSEVYAGQLGETLKNLVKRNPDILSQDDLSDEKINSIKVEVARSTVKKYKEKYTNTVLLSEHLSRIESAIGKPIPPALKQVILRYAKDFAYQFVFGFIDNVVLILAGAALDDYIKIAFGAEKLKKVLSADDLDFITDGVGNSISDGVGDLGGGAVDRSVNSWEWMEEAATDNQMEIATPMQKLMATTATFTGVVLGCVVAIPVGIIVLKGLSAVGVAATAGMSATSTGLSAGLGLVAAGLMTYTAYEKFKMLDEQGQRVYDNALKRVISAVYKHKRLAGEELSPIESYGSREFTLDLEDPETKEIAQDAWTREMDFADLASYEDAGKNKIWWLVDNMSSDYNLTNPNRTSIDESRWQKIAGII